MSIDGDCYHEAEQHFRRLAPPDYETLIEDETYRCGSVLDFWSQTTLTESASPAFVPCGAEVGQRAFQIIPAEQALSKLIAHHRSVSSNSGEESADAQRREPIPGVFYLPRALDRKAQLRLAIEAIVTWAHEGRSNLSAEGSSEVSSLCDWGPNLVDSARLRRLRWVTLGRQYDWANRVYLENTGFSERLPEPLRKVFFASCTKLPIGEFEEPTAAICNYYHAAVRISDRMGGHKDDVEPDCTSPLVSVCLGLPCIFLLGGLSREDPVTPLLLKAGDVLVLTGKARHLYHGVPRVLVPPRLQNKAERRQALKRKRSVTTADAHVDNAGYCVKDVAEAKEWKFPKTWTAYDLEDPELPGLARLAESEIFPEDAENGTSNSRMEKEKSLLEVAAFLERTRMNFSIRSAG